MNISNPSINAEKKNQGFQSPNEYLVADSPFPKVFSSKSEIAAPTPPLKKPNQKNDLAKAEIEEAVRETKALSYSVTTKLENLISEAKIKIDILKNIDATKSKLFTSIGLDPNSTQIKPESLRSLKLYVKKAEDAVNEIKRISPNYVLPIDDTSANRADKTLSMPPQDPSMFEEYDKLGTKLNNILYVASINLQRLAVKLP
jgi:hypothetical protein